MAEIKLGGKAYELKLSFRALRALESHYGMNIEKVFKNKMSDGTLESMVTLLWACIRGTNRKLTVEKVEDMLDAAIEGGDVTFEQLGKVIRETVESSKLLNTAKDGDNGDDVKN